jgi:hypothetical protein
MAESFASHVLLDNRSLPNLCAWVNRAIWLFKTNRILALIKTFTFSWVKDPTGHLGVVCRAIVSAKSLTMS